MCTITGCSHNLAIAAAVVGESCPRSPDVFRLHPSKASGKDPGCPAGGKEGCSSSGRGSLGQREHIALDVLGALGTQDGLRASAAVSQDAAEGTAALARAGDRGFQSRGPWLPPSALQLHPAPTSGTQPSSPRQPEVTQRTEGRSSESQTCGLTQWVSIQ